jgi:hypothetical protein
MTKKYKKINNLNLKSLNLEGLVINALRRRQNQGDRSKHNTNRQYKSDFVEEYIIKDLRTTYFDAVNQFI